MEKLENNESLMDISVVVNTLQVLYGEHLLYQYNIKRQNGSIIALPFFSYDIKQKQKFEGYLIYHDKHSCGYSEKELYNLGLETIINYSPSGMAGKLIPLPYKPIREEDIEDALDSLIEKNTWVNLTDNLSL